MAQPPTGPARRLCEYFDAIEKEGGTAKRWTLLKIAGNETALNRWLSTFIKNGCLLELRNEVDGSKSYRKTELGETFHRMLRDGNAVKIMRIMLENLSGDRLRP